jgi:hypothetical protein
VQARQKHFQGTNRDCITTLVATVRAELCRKRLHAPRRVTASRYGDNKSLQCPLLAPDCLRKARYKPEAHRSVHASAITPNKIMTFFNITCSYELRKQLPADEPLFYCDKASTLNRLSAEK